MKRNITNLVVIAIIIVIAPLIMAAMALAAEPIPHGIRGQYAFTGGAQFLSRALALKPISEPKDRRLRMFFRRLILMEFTHSSVTARGRIRDLITCLHFLSQYLTPMPLHPLSPSLPAQGLRILHSYFTIL